MLRAFSIFNLTQMKFGTIPFREEWANMFHSPEDRGIWMLHGGNPQNNSMFAISLAKELDELGYKTMYLSLRSVSKFYCETTYEKGWRMHLHRIITSSFISVRELGEYLSKQKAPNIIIIDPIHYWTDFEGTTAMELLDLSKKNPNKLFIYMGVSINGQIVGEVASSIGRYAALSVDTDNNQVTFL